MKKTLAIFLSALMIAMIIVPTLAYADGDTLVLELSADTTTVKAGEATQITVTVTATANPGWFMFSAKSDCPDGFTQPKENVTYGDIGIGTKGKNATIDAGDEMTTETGMMFSFKVDVADTVAEGTYTITLKSVDVVDDEEGDVPYTVTGVTITVAACQHTGNTTQHDAVVSTCKTAGHAAYTTCDDCGAVIAGDATPLALDPSNHEGEPENVAAVPSTCSVKGTAAGTKCSACNAILSGCTELDLDPANHPQESINSVDAVASTCTVAGHGAYTFCSACNTFITGTPDPLPLNENNHPQESINSVEAVPSTCTVAGHAAYTECTACNTVITGSKDPLPLDETNHPNTENREEVPATCTEAGTKAGVYCLDENKFISGGETIEALNHQWGEVTYTWADDNSTCTAARSCQRDGCNAEETELVNSTSQVKTPATCEAKGTTTYTATFTTNAAFQTQSKDVEDIDALNHSWGAVTYTWADDNSTCTATRTCQRDGCNAVETETVTATSVVTTEPTTEAEGVRTYTATFENSLFKTQTTTEAIDKLATATTDGGEWKDDSKEGLDVKVPEGLTGTPSAVSVTGKEGEEITLTEDEYTFEDGVLTLSPEFLAGLPAGEYTLSFRVDNTVVTAAITTVDVPSTTTGDNTASLILWSVIALTSLAGAVVTATKIKKASVR